MSEFFAVIGTMILVVLAIAAGALIMVSWENHNYKSFIEVYSKKPYCLEESASVLDKKIELKRCWKVVEQ